jgi:hypothetical protein
MVFERRSRGLVIFLFILSFLSCLIILSNVISRNTPSALFTVSNILLSAGLILNLFNLSVIFGTKYILNDDKLDVVYWKYRTLHIPYASINSVKYLIDIGVEIHYKAKNGKVKKIIVHPKNKDDFIKELGSKKL